MRICIKNFEHEKASSVRNRVFTMLDSFDYDELKSTINNTPSLRGMILGYVAEVMFERHVLNNLSNVDNIIKFDDHDRKNNKADRSFVYQNRRYTVQLKSVQTNSIYWDQKDQILRGYVQNDGSDKRTVRLPNGNEVQTTNYVVDDYDILAVPLFLFTGTWSFAYKRNVDCRLTESKKYRPEDRQYLLASGEPFTYPLSSAWTNDLLSLCDGILAKRSYTVSGLQEFFT